MQVHELRVGRKRRKRLGRGIGSRRGTYSTRGVKGQKARAGARIRPGFEGGQTPLYARLPKRRGFKSLAPKAAVVTLGNLESSFASGALVTVSALRRTGLVGKRTRKVKILANGTLKKSLVVQGVPVSASARSAIEKLGGRVV